MILLADLIEHLETSFLHASGGDPKLANDIAKLEESDLNSYGSDAAVYVRRGATLNMYKNVTIKDYQANGSTGGGGVCVEDATFNMYGGTIDNCWDGTFGRFGGGVLVSGKTATFNMYDGTIKDCKEQNAYGGGVGVNDGTFNMYGGTITNNSTAQCGGGVFAYYSTFNTSDNDQVTIVNNIANVDGGGIYNATGSTSTLNGSTLISGNTAKDSGGGIYSESTITLNDKTSITNNSAVVDAGGVYNEGDLALNKTVSITDNTAKLGAGIYTVNMPTGTAASYNNVASEAGDDVVIEQPNQSLDSPYDENKDYVLKSTNKKITGWFTDEKDNRWSPNSYTKYSTTTSEGETPTTIYLKAAHESEPKYTVEWYAGKQEKPVKVETRKGNINSEVSVTDDDKKLEGYTYTGDDYSKNILTTSTSN